MNTGWTARADFIIFKTHVLLNHSFYPQEISSSFGRIQSKFLSWCAGIALAAAGLCYADDFPAQRQLAEDLARLTEAPAQGQAVAVAQANARVFDDRVSSPKQAPLHGRLHDFVNRLPGEAHDFRHLGDVAASLLPDDGLHVEFRAHDLPWREKTPRV